MAQLGTHDEINQHTGSRICIHLRKFLALWLHLPSGIAPATLEERLDKGLSLRQFHHSSFSHACAAGQISCDATQARLAGLKQAPVAPVSPPPSPASHSSIITGPSTITST
jgi:hypothetical protein